MLHSTVNSAFSSASNSASNSAIDSAINGMLEMAPVAAAHPTRIAPVQETDAYHAKRGTCKLGVFPNYITLNTSSDVDINWQ
jgi:hypothetical protein